VPIIKGISKEIISESMAFTVVGIGASAGGVEAFRELLKELPVDTGMAFVIIQHLSPNYESFLTEILSRETKLPVTKVEDGLRIEPNHVYVIPPKTEMGILQGILHLVPRTEEKKINRTIDFFLKSLAADQKEKAIGIVLSGTGSDGTEGLRAIKSEGGIVFAQEPKSAKFDNMPKNAIAACDGDFVLPTEGIAKELARISRHMNGLSIYKTRLVRIKK
jgi:two-component system CheB/CheR fusion protein